MNENFYVKTTFIKKKNTKLTNFVELASTGAKKNRYDLLMYQVKTNLLLQCNYKLLCSTTTCYED